MPQTGERGEGGAGGGGEGRVGEGEGGGEGGEGDCCFPQPWPCLQLHQLLLRQSRKLAVKDGTHFFSPYLPSLSFSHTVTFQPVTTYSCRLKNLFRDVAL